MNLDYKMKNGGWVCYKKHRLPNDTDFESEYSLTLDQLLIVANARLVEPPNYDDDGEKAYLLSKTVRNGG